MLLSERLFLCYSPLPLTLYIRLSYSRISRYRFRPLESLILAYSMILDLPSIISISAFSFFFRFRSPFT